jgi:hypothetical protein
MRKLIAICAVAVGVLIVGTQLHASKKDASSDPFEQAEAIARQAMNLLGKGEIDEMFACLKPHCPMDEKDLQQLQTMLKQQREFIRPSLGKPMGDVERISEDGLGNSFVRYTYLEKWDNSAFVWKLTFYRARDRWQINQITWNDKPMELLR